MSLSETIKQKAFELGFDACGIAHLEPFENDAAYLRKWLDEGKNGEMQYLNNYFDKRTSPNLLFEHAKSAIVVLLNYFPTQKQDKNVLQIAKYAYGTDYHYVVKDKLRKLQAFIDTQAESQFQICCDSAPVLERRLAERAGLGWIGRSGMLINPKLGSYTVIGEIITTIQLDYDQPIQNQCANCHACLNVCPTRAISACGFDARKCASYLTIECKGDIPEEQAKLLGNRLFGCDTCLDICPWNKNAQPNRTEEFTPQEAFYRVDWQAMTKSEFKKLFKNSPLQRAGYEKLCKRAQQIISQKN